MDIQTATQLISTVGFPICCCIFMAWLIMDMNTKHADEMNSIKDALNANTTAISKLETLINQLVTRLNSKE